MPGRVGQSDYLTVYLNPFELRPDRIGLLLIDMQYATGSRTHGLGRFLTETGRQEDATWRYDQIEKQVIPNLSRLLAVFRDRSLPVFHVTTGSTTGDYSDLLPQIRPIHERLQNRRGHLHHEILEELKPCAGEYLHNKTTLGAFESTGIDAALRFRGVHQVIIGGISTNACVLATAFGAADRGYQATILSDGCSATRESYHLGALESFGRLFGRVMSTEEVLGALAD